MDDTELKGHIASLPPWGPGDFDHGAWEAYLRVARIVQEADPDTVEAALEQFLQEAIKEEFKGTTSESKPFLLMRVVFDLPEAAPASERRSFKGWINWPTPNAHGEVSLAWPLSWRSGKPQLLASYAGSEGGPYDASNEYRFLRQCYPYRDLSGR